MTLIFDVGALANEQAARQQAESDAAAAAAAAAATAANNNLLNSGADIRLIPKPRGSPGDGYCLIEEMGLETDKLSYNAIVVSYNDTNKCSTNVTIVGHCTRIVLRRWP